MSVPTNVPKLRFSSSGTTMLYCQWSYHKFAKFIRKLYRDTNTWEKIFNKAEHGLRLTYYSDLRTVNHGILNTAVRKKRAVFFVAKPKCKFKDMGEL